MKNAVTYGIITGTQLAASAARVGMSASGTPRW
ncbi:Uncharacterised protein [Mycobacteroides abscessus]|nr:Uncharacterised protein [Mycobacteroides abscessus]